MAEASRSLSACLRCRRQKLKCEGPSQPPCRRCRASKAECVFVPPKATRSVGSSAGPTGAIFADKLEQLEQRLDLMEGQHRAEMQEMKNTVARLADKLNLSPKEVGSTPLQSTIPNVYQQDEGVLNDTIDIVSHGLVGENEWKELYAFFNKNCRTVIGFMDDQIYPPIGYLRRHALLSIVICIIAARAIKPEKYQIYIAHADDLLKDTFSGPTPDIHAFRAMMLLTAWTGRARLWGYVASVAAELDLNTAALQLGDDAVKETATLIERTRAWFSLCCFDLVSNLNRPFVINRMREYLPIAKRLLNSPYCRPVDYRINAYIEGFTIAADAKAQLPKCGLQLKPLPEEAAQLLTSFDQKIDRWFYAINNGIEPYQTFTNEQDRHQFVVPFAFMKIYINGFAMHGMNPEGDVPDANRLGFIQKALDNANLLLHTQFASDDFRRRLRYSMDYDGMTTYHSISFILKAITAAHQYLDYGKVFTALREAAQMFEEAGALEAANEVRREQERLAMLTQTRLPPLENDAAPGLAIEEAVLFDIPSFLDAATWDEQFPTLSMYVLD